MSKTQYSADTVSKFLEIQDVHPAQGQSVTLTIDTFLGVLLLRRDYERP